MKRWHLLVAIIGIVVVLPAAVATLAWTPLPIADDPLVRMPGTQPDQGVGLEGPHRCLNCHAGYDAAVEPGFNWKGSMMSQAARDFVFYACLTVAGQDSVWATGRPNAVDICERCHFPKGWLEGRSDPPNASAMTGADFDGVECDFCHTKYDPFFELTYSGDPDREGSDWLNYWDETNASGTPSQPAANATYLEDRTLALDITLFNGLPFYSGSLPFSFPDYIENASGQYYVSPGGEKRASFADAAARHQMYYSRYHKSRYFCGTCHDVSNPVLANLAFDGTPPGDGTTVLPTEASSAYSYYHVERTFSEFMLSDYGLLGGAPGIGPYAPEVFDTSYPNNYIAKCQDCHMRDVVGVGCNKTGVPIRPAESIEHPNSGQPLHDMTGGNAWVSYVLASAVPGSPNYDSTNAGLLNQGPAVLTLDLTQGEGIDPVALLAGVDRAKQQLVLAASIEGLDYDCATGELWLRVQNQTGHKLISGFPEGRRMFLNIRAYSQESLIFEANPYDPTAGTLKGLDPAYSPNSPPLEAGEVHLDELVYETHPSSTLTGEDETFHFALATGRYKDNRIPPKGFRVAESPDRLCEPVWHGAAALDYFSPDEYAGGHDDVSLTIPVGASTVEVRLYYQTTSREYIEFLRDEIKGSGRLTLPAEAYIIQTDPFFSGLSAWGDAIWQLWDHNKNVPGAAPFLMTEASLVVIDDIPPAIVCPADAAETSWNCEPVAVDIGSATATDNCAVISLTNDAPDLFPPGLTLVTWTACDGAGNCTSCTQTVSVNCAPTCAPDYSPAIPAPDEVVTFTSGATDPDGTVVAIEWDFGDGHTASGDPATHQYAEQGSYTVYVTVVDNQGAYATCQTDILIEPANEPPTCCFTAPASAGVGEAVQFSDCSTDDGVIISWSWDFGDGEGSSEQNPTHQFAVEGNYEVCLTVTDDGALSTTCCQSISIVAVTTLSFFLAGPAWHMIALPCEPIDPDPAVVFDELDPYGEPSLLSGNLHRWDPVAIGYKTWHKFAPEQFGGPLRVGEGYWLWVYEDITVAYEAGCEYGEKVIHFETDGWHMIGNPQNGYIDVRRPDMQAELDPYGRIAYCEATPVSNPSYVWIGDPLTGYDPAAVSYYYPTCSELYPDHELRPFEGYWADVKEASLIMYIPPPP